MTTEDIKQKAYLLSYKYKDIPDLALFTDEFRGNVEFSFYLKTESGMHDIYHDFLMQGETDESIDKAFAIADTRLGKIASYYNIRLS